LAWPLPDTRAEQDLAIAGRRLDFRSLDLQALSAFGEARDQCEMYGGTVMGRGKDSTGLRKVIQVTELENVAFSAECIIGGRESVPGRLVMFSGANAEQLDLADDAAAYPGIYEPDSFASQQISGARTPGKATKMAGGFGL